MTKFPRDGGGKAPLEAGKDKRRQATADDNPLKDDPRVVAIDVELDPPKATTPRKGGRPCPVTALGTYDGVYFFLSRRGEYRVLGFNQMRVQGLVSLFDGDTSWPIAVCGTEKVGGWSEKALFSRLVRDCVRAGFFDPLRDMRKAGVWRIEGKSGAVRLLVHCGDRVLLPAELAPADRLIGPAEQPPGYAWVRAGFKLGDTVYPVSPAVPPPAAKPCSGADIHALLELLKSWNWRQPGEAPRLILGHIGCASVCGALIWRPHTWTCGQPVSGKSYLEQLISGIVGPIAYRVTDPTEAGLRQGLDGAARPCFLDEINIDGNADKVRALIKLVKIASTDNQAPVVRGTAEGRAKQYMIRTVVYLTSKTHVRLRSDDSSRITVLDLDTFEPEREVGAARRTIATLKANVRGFVELGPAIQMRAICQFPVFLANLDVLRGVLAECGQTSRQVDQLGAQLAYAEALLNDDVIDELGARELVAEFDLAELSGFGDDTDPFQCWDHLLTSTIDVVNFEGKLERTSIGEAVATVVPGQTDSPAAKALRRHGIVVRNHQIGSDTVVCIVVANTHAGLEELFRGTGFSDGRWKILDKLPNAFRGKRINRVNFSGRKTRCVWIPASPEVFEFDRDTADDE